MNLYINHYEDRNPRRNEELRECLRINLINPYIHKIILVCESIVDYQDDEKIEVELVENRPTYNDFFRIIRERNTGDDISIIANSDIHFDQTLELVEKNLFGNSCYALSRYDVTEIGLVPFHRPDSQDAWMIRGNPPHMIGADFTMGVAGCDNRIAHILSEYGYIVRNPCQSITVYHRHRSGIRNYIADGKVERVIGHYKLLHPCEI